MIEYEDQLMLRILHHLQNNYIKIILNNSTDIVGQLEAFNRHIRNISASAICHITSTNGEISESQAPEIRTLPDPPVILVNGKIKIKNSVITASKVFIRGNAISIIKSAYPEESKMTGEKLKTYILNQPGHYIKNKVFIKCQRIGDNN